MGIFYIYELKIVFHFHFCLYSLPSAVKALLTHYLKPAASQPPASLYKFILSQCKKFAFPASSTES